MYVDITGKINVTTIGHFVGHLLIIFHSSFHWNITHLNGNDKTDIIKVTARIKRSIVEIHG